MLLEDKNAVICGAVASAKVLEQTHPQRTEARRMSI